ncbi:mCG1027990, partial [Mus musculus]
DPPASAFQRLELKVSDHKHYSGNSQITSLPTLSHSYETSGGLSFLDWREAPALSKELEGFWSLG